MLISSNSAFFQYSYGVDSGTLSWIDFLDPAQGKTGRLVSVLERLATLQGLLLFNGIEAVLVPNLIVLKWRALH